MAIVVSEWPSTAGFDHVKAVQMVAFFVRKAGGAIDKLKLIKLIYLSDRASFARRSQPMNFDDYYSLPNGPIASSALNGINGQAANEAWQAVRLKGIRVFADEGVGVDHLSRNDLAILEEVWGEFGELTAGQICNWTHKNCPEYIEVTSSRIPITYDEILEAIRAPDADQTSRELKRLQREISRLPVANGS